MIGAMFSIRKAIMESPEPFPTPSIFLDGFDQMLDFGFET